MALVYANRVYERTTTTGTGTVILDGAVVGHQTFNNGVGTANTCHYTIGHQSNAEWEVGTGTVATPTTLARTTLLDSSRTGSITDATNATPIVITSAAHGLSNAESVVVSGVGGNTAANGTFTVANVTTNTFELSASVGNGAYTTGGTWIARVSFSAGVKDVFLDVPASIVDGFANSDGDSFTDVVGFQLKDATELTISAGVITVTQAAHRVDGELDADDDLDTINTPTQEDVIWLRPENAARNITLKHGAGNIVTPSGVDYVLPDNAFVQLLYDGTNWRLNAPDLGDAIRKDGTQAWTGDQSLGGFDLTNIGRLQFTAASELTISTGAITITGTMHTVDGQGDASDDLDTITAAGTEDFLILRPENVARNITIKHGTGNILTPFGSDYTIPDNGAVALAYDGANWRLLTLGDAMLAAIATLSTTGLIVRSAAGTAVTRTITGTANQISVADGDGVAANPTLSTPQNIHTAATPQFAKIGINQAAGASNQIVGTSGNNQILAHFTGDSNTFTSVGHTVVTIDAQTSQDMTDGYGPQLRFQATDSAVTDQRFGEIRACRDGGDTNGRFKLMPYNGGAASTGIEIDTNDNLLVNTSTSPSAGGAGILVFGDNGADPTMGTNTCSFYGKDVAGTVEGFVCDEAGTATQLSRHHDPDLAAAAGIVLDPADPFPQIDYEVQHYLGKAAMSYTSPTTGVRQRVVVDLPAEEVRDWTDSQIIAKQRCEQAIQNWDAAMAAAVTSAEAAAVEFESKSAEFEALAIVAADAITRAEDAAGVADISGDPDDINAAAVAAMEADSAISSANAAKTQADAAEATANATASILEDLGQQTRPAPHTPKTPPQWMQDRGVTFDQSRYDAAGDIRAQP